MVRRLLDHGWDVRGKSDRLRENRRYPACTLPIWIPPIPRRIVPDLTPRDRPSYLSQQMTRMQFVAARRFQHHPPSFLPRLHMVRFIRSPEISSLTTPLFLRDDDPSTFQTPGRLSNLHLPQRTSCSGAISQRRGRHSTSDASFLDDGVTCSIRVESHRARWFWAMRMGSRSTHTSAPNSSLFTLHCDLHPKRT
jgi:hypothetical protein